MVAGRSIAGVADMAEQKRRDLIARFRTVDNLMTAPTANTDGAEERRASPNPFLKSATRGMLTTVAKMTLTDCTSRATSNTGGSPIAYCTLAALVQSSLAAALAADELTADQRLDYDAFIALIPQATREQHSEETIQQVFNAVDVDGSKSITRDEFFAWTVSWAQQFSGTTTAGVCRAAAPSN